MASTGSMDPARIPSQGSGIEAVLVPVVDDSGYSHGLQEHVFLRHGVISLGRSERRCNVLLRSPQRPRLISRIHARIMPKNIIPAAPHVGTPQATSRDAESSKSSWVICDENSLNGTFVNNRRIGPAWFPLSDGDWISFGGIARSNLSEGVRCNDTVEGSPAPTPDSGIVSSSGEFGTRPVANARANDTEQVGTATSNQASSSRAESAIQYRFHLFDSWVKLRSEQPSSSTEGTASEAGPSSIKVGSGGENTGVAQVEALNREGTRRGKKRGSPSGVTEGSVPGLQPERKVRKSTGNCSPSTQDLHNMGQGVANVPEASSLSATNSAETAQSNTSYSSKQVNVESCPAVAANGLGVDEGSTVEALNQTSDGAITEQQERLWMPLVIAQGLPTRSNQAGTQCEGSEAFLPNGALSSDGDAGAESDAQLSQEHPVPFRDDVDSCKVPGEESENESICYGERNDEECGCGLDTFCMKCKSDKKECEEDFETRTVGDVLGKLASECTCPVCHDVFVATATLECGHSFCSECIDTWLRERRSCPVCRITVLDAPVRSCTLDSMAHIAVTSSSALHKSWIERKTEHHRKQEHEVNLKRDLECRLADAQSKGFRFLQIEKRWNRREKRRFRKGIRCHVGESRVVYCKSVGLTSEFVFAASLPALQLVAYNLSIPNLNTLWSKETSSVDAKKLRARLSLFLRYG